MDAEGIHFGGIRGEEILSCNEKNTSFFELLFHVHFIVPMVRDILILPTPQHLLTSEKRLFVGRLSVNHKVSKSCD